MDVLEIWSLMPRSSKVSGYDPSIGICLLNYLLFQKFISSIAAITCQSGDNNDMVSINKLASIAVLQVCMIGYISLIFIELKIALSSSLFFSI